MLALENEKHTYHVSVVGSREPTTLTFLSQRFDFSLRIVHTLPQPACKPSPQLISFASLPNPARLVRRLRMPGQCRSLKPPAARGAIFTCKKLTNSLSLYDVLKNKGETLCDVRNAAQRARVSRVSALHAPVLAPAQTVRTFQANRWTRLSIPSIRQPHAPANCRARS